MKMASTFDGLTLTWLRLSEIILSSFLCQTPLSLQKLFAEEAQLLHLCELTIILVSLQI